MREQSVSVYQDRTSKLLEELSFCVQKVKPEPGDIIYISPANLGLTWTPQYVEWLQDNMQQIHQYYPQCIFVVLQDSINVSKNIIHRESSE